MTEIPDRLAAAPQQRQFLATLLEQVTQGADIRAVWLEGSFGRGDADRYSDLDIHLLVARERWPDFQRDAAQWLAGVCPLVLCTSMFDGQMLNALTADGLRVDLWLHEGNVLSLERAKVQVLYDAGGHVTLDKPPAQRDPLAEATHLERQIQEFWRCISLLPAVIGRAELIVALMGLGVEINLLTDILVRGYGMERDAGVKKLNRYLPAGTRAALEDALGLHGLTRESLVRAHLSLAAILQRHGPAVAQRWGCAYPDRLEATVLRHVTDELAALGLALAPLPEKE